MPTAYATRRLALADAIGDRAAAILVAPAPASRSHDTYYPYRTDSDLYYLTGFDEPEAVMVFVPGHELGDLHLFVRPRDAFKEQWEGRRVGPRGVEERFEADRGRAIEELEEALPDLLAHRERLYYEPGSHRLHDECIARVVASMRRARGRYEYAPSARYDLRRLTRRMRLLKDDQELALLRTAAEITAQAHLLAMRRTAPGMREYQLKALLEYHFAAHGAQSPAYETIVAGGSNALVMHYIENRDRLNEGDLVLVDAGCEYHHYAADITRTWPVSGRFKPAQRDLYEATLAIQLELIDACASHATISQLNELMARRYVEALRDLGILHGQLEALLEARAHKPYAPHGFGHWLGLDVHDVSPYLDARGSIALRAGHVLTIEPGLYIPLDAEDAPEALRGQGVRIEDDVLITEQGVEILTATCPKAIDALEELVGRDELDFPSVP